MDRHARQSKLAEVGELGQARIARARVDIHLEGLAADVAARYLAGAGVAGIRVRAAHAAEGARALAPGVVVEVDPALSLDDAAPAFGLRDATCQQVVRGAHAALRALRAAVDGTSAAPPRRGRDLDGTSAAPPRRGRDLGEGRG